MDRLKLFRVALIGGASAFALTHSARGGEFNIPRGDLAAALEAYTQQARVEIIYSDDAVRGRRSPGAKGNLTETAALTEVLRGTGFTAQTTPSKAIGIVPANKPVAEEVTTTKPLKVAAAAPAPGGGIETVVVTAEKKQENIQQVPIAITAMTQQQLTERQIAGGPDLVKEVPNLTFSKTNFSGYNLQIRGIGTQAISVTTDPAVAVAFNGTPFIRNHFFEQEFFDVQDVEVLRGPQGTLYGRNATAGVVNVKSALPTDQYEAMASVDIGNYNERRLEGMVNLPIVGDRLDLRFAGEWTKRDGYSFDEQTGQPVDGRDLWSGRMTIGWKPRSDLQAYFVWEHFSEDDDRLRSGKQLCQTDPGPSVVNGPTGPQTVAGTIGGAFLSQGCVQGSLYAPSAFGTPNATSNPFVAFLEVQPGFIPLDANPYAGVEQSHNLRVIDSLLSPSYRAKNDTLELNVNYNVTPALTITSQTGYNNDFLYSTEDYDRFNTAPGLFVDVPGLSGYIGQDGQFCDPQLGCSSRLVGQDVSVEHGKQFSQEMRLTSNYSGPVNFSVGANFLHYSTTEDYYVFYNGITLLTEFLENGGSIGPDVPHAAFNPAVADRCPPPPATIPPNLANVLSIGCAYIDPNPLSQINGSGHNYFRSENPYRLTSYAGFGEVYYQVTPDLKLTGGLRWTDDMKSFTDIPSWTLLAGSGYPVAGTIDQSWKEWTGRFNASWMPSLDFTNQSLFYASYARGYKGGGANPPGVAPDVTNTGLQLDSPSDATHPATFKPEFVDAFELGTKNSLLEGALTINADVFYYKYQNYQISQIVDRTSVNLNFNATVKGAEMESTWEPLPGLRFNFAGGYENAPLAKGSQAIDLIDRTAGTPGWMVVKPFVTQTSNCVLPTYVVNELLANGNMPEGCLQAYTEHEDPITQSPYVPNPAGFPGYPGFNPASAPNQGQGFYKNIAGNQLPSTPPFTLSIGSQYSLPVTADWAATLRADFYWQGNSFARVFNDRPYDSIHGYTNLNLALILANDDGWQVMAYVKNVFDVTAITGAFLNSDDSGLTTNIFTTDPRLFGVRITKNFDGADTRDSDHGWIDNNLDTYFTDMLDFLTDKDGGPPPLWIELGGQYALLDESQQRFSPSFLSLLPASLPSPLPAQRLPGAALDWNGKVSFKPDGSDWTFSAAVRYGRSSSTGGFEKVLPPTKVSAYGFAQVVNYVEGKSYEQEIHTILDFAVGKDVGLGMFGGTSELSGGVRVAQFMSGQIASINAVPDFHAHLYDGHLFKGSTQGKHSFHGIGPTFSWDASAPIIGNVQNGEISFDWGANAALLFGRRMADIHHQTSECHLSGYTCPGVYAQAGTIRRSRTAAVPDLGGFVGLSMRYSNAKVSFGYRADEFFGAMDTGYESEKTTNLGFFGPYANISIGVGG